MIVGLLRRWDAVQALLVDRTFPKDRGRPTTIDQRLLCYNSISCIQVIIPIVRGVLHFETSPASPAGLFRSQRVVLELRLHLA